MKRYPRYTVQGALSQRDLGKPPQLAGYSPNSGQSVRDRLLQRLQPDHKQSVQVLHVPPETHHSPLTNPQPLSRSALPQRDKKEFHLGVEDENFMEAMACPPFDAPFDTICHPSSSKNVSVHLDFDLFLDLDDELEEFNQLSRLGDFSRAERYFDRYLKAESVNPWVFIQYADMLLEKGDYKSFQQLNAEPIFGQAQSNGISEVSDAFLKLELNWLLLNAVALSYCQHKVQPIPDGVKRLGNFLPASKDMGTTEVSATKLRCFYGCIDCSHVQN